MQVERDGKRQMQSEGIAEAKRGVVIRVENFYKSGDFKYYITNQCITNVLTGEQDLLFESLIMTHAVAFMSKQSGDVYFYHDLQNKEIDLILDVEYEYEHYLCLYGIKMNENVDSNTNLLEDSITEMLTDWGIILDRGTIYRDGIQCSNRNTKLISVEEFLLNLCKYSIELFESYISDNKEGY